MSSPICPSVLHLCFVRATSVSAVGDPVGPPNNYYCTANPMMLTITPDILTGDSKDMKGGCDQLIATYRGQDILKRFNLELDMGTVEPGLEELLTGGGAILDGSSNAIGLDFQVPCGTQQPYSAIEAWQDLWDCDYQPSSPYQYMRWVFPSSRWQRAAQTLQNDFNQPKYTGFTVGNPNWGEGIYGDTTVSIGPNGGYFYDNELPNAACGWQSQSVT